MPFTTTSPLTGGSGNANTGDITFDGVKIIGAGTASGDGANLGTIELVPDGDIASDQYIIIDPTAPNHIHIRPGGTQDASTADLIIGGEKTNVKVSDNASNVRIATSSENFTFVRTNENIAASNIFSNTNSLDLFNAVALGWVAINSLGVTAQLQEWTFADGAYQFSVAEANFFQPATNYTFRNDDGFDGDRQWIFGSNGVFEGPADGGVSVYGLGNVSGTDLTLASSNGIEMLATNDITLASNNGDIILNPDSGAYLYSESPENEIATIGDLGVDTTFTVVGGTLGTQPTFTGTPLFTGSYVKTGPMIHFRIDVDMDNITSFGTGQYYVDLPFPAKYNYHFRNACLHDVSMPRQFGLSGHVSAGESRVTLFYTDTSGQDVAFDYNSPALLTTSDNFHISGDYIAEDDES
jgi:hypothetical protein